MTDKRSAQRALRYVHTHPWAIQSEWLQVITDIAARAQEPNFDAVLARQGQRLDRTEGVIMRDDVAVIEITGPIFRYANLFTAMSGATSIESVAIDFREALDNPRVAAIVLAIDSPGGQTNGVQEFADMVHEARRVKPVVAYVNELGASAAYFIAAAAGEVVMAPMAAVGSIGVVATLRTDKDPDRLEFVSSQSPNKRVDVGTQEGRAKIQAHVDALAAVFIGRVASYRGVATETVEQQFGAGGVLVGEAAVEAGMADRLGSLEDVIAGLSGTTTGATSMGIKSGSPEITRELIEKEHPTIAEAIRADAVKDLQAKHEAELSRVQAEYLENLGAVRADERERIFAVEAQLLPGHEALIAKFKADGKTTGPEAAVAVLAAERASAGAALTKLMADGGEIKVQPSREPKQPAADLADAPVEERCKAEWDSTPELRKEFGEFASYLAYTKASESGQVRYLRDKRQAG